MQVLEAMPECQELIVSCVSPMDSIGLTDRTLHRWAIQEKLPKKILLNDIQANFTIDGVISLINVSLFFKKVICKKFEQSSFTVSPTILQRVQNEKSKWTFFCIIRDYTFLNK